MAVLLFHAGHLQGGFLGVDLFFVLSGFLITSLLIRDAEAGGVALSRFWGRRFRRLLPAVFVMIATVAVWSWLFGSAADLDGVKQDGIFGLVYLANWHFIGDAAGYWASFEQPSMFDHLWSLSIEEQFYVVWPIVVLGVWHGAKRPQRTLLILAISGIGASLLAMIVLDGGDDPTRAYMGTDTRAASLLVGVLAATAPCRALAQRIVMRLGRRLDLLIATILVGIVCSWVLVDGAGTSPLYRGGLLAHSTACAALIGLVCAGHGLVGRGLSLGPLVWIGTISYGLYLWHWPLYVILSPERTGFDGVGLTAARIAASFGAAVISFAYVENPVRRRVIWSHGRRGAVVLAVSVVGLIGLLILVPEPTSEIASFDPTTISVAAAPMPLDAIPVPSVTVEGTTDEMLRDVPSAPTTAAETASVVPRATLSAVVWAGDSVAFELEPGVTAALTSAGMTVVNSAFYGVRLLGPIEDRRLSIQVPDKLTSISADTLMIMVSAWDRDIGDDDYAAGLRELADLLPVDGRLVVLSSSPTADDDRTAALDRLAGLARSVAESSNGRIVFIDTSGALVSPPERDIDGDGAPEFKSDLIHVCPAGSAQFGAWLVNELDARFDGLEPVDASIWAAGDWVTEPRFDVPVGACARVG